MRHASLTPYLANGVAERPGHSHAHLAEASSNPWRAVDDERVVLRVRGAIPIHVPPGTARSPDKRSLGYCYLGCRRTQ